MCLTFPSRQALHIVTLQKNIDLNVEEVLKEVRLLPDVVSRGPNGQDVLDKEKFQGKILCLSKEDMNSLLNIFKAEFGRSHWKNDVKMLDKVVLQQLLSEQYDKSKFNAFTSKVINELASSCGRKVLSGCVMKAQEVVSGLIMSMTSKIEMLYLSCNTENEKRICCERELLGLENALEKTVSEVLEQHLECFKSMLIHLNTEYKERMVTKINDCRDKLIENRQAITGFTLEVPPDQNMLDKRPYLKSVEGRNYWEVPKSEDVRELEKGLRNFTERALAKSNRKWLSDARKLLTNSVAELKDKFIEALSPSTNENTLWIADVTAKEVTLNQLPPLDLPDTDMSDHTKVKEKRKVYGVLHIYNMIVVHLRIFDPFLFIYRCGTHSFWLL